MSVLDLNELFLEPLLCCLGRVFWVMLEYPSTTRFQCPDWFQCPGPDGTWPRPSDAVQLSCPLSRNPPPPPPQSITFSTFMFDGGDGVLGVIGSIPPPWVDAKELDFGLIWKQHFQPLLLWIIGKLQTGLYMCFLEQGDLAGAAGFQSFTA